MDRRLAQPTAFHVGVTVNPGADDLDREMRRFDYKLEAGADFIVTRPVFDARSFDRVAARLETSETSGDCSASAARERARCGMDGERNAGSQIPDDVLDRMRRAQYARGSGG